MLDVVLHDGSPDVGGAWSQEATTLASLVVDALRLAVVFLAPMGTFVSMIWNCIIPQFHVEIGEIDSDTALNGEEAMAEQCEEDVPPRRDIGVKPNSENETVKPPEERGGDPPMEQVMETVSNETNVCLDQGAGPNVTVCQEQNHAGIAIIFLDNKIFFPQKSARDYWDKIVSNFKALLRIIGKKATIEGSKVESALQD
ncbi:hypothetical protein SUGI_0341430 [Cryptomeria japonica]|nr:hypothetical protein SUGI_0341430 [Cryptomeria japonica]